MMLDVLTNAGFRGGDRSEHRFCKEARRGSPHQPPVPSARAAARSNPAHGSDRQSLGDGSAPSTAMRIGVADVGVGTLPESAQRNTWRTGAVAAGVAVLATAIADVAFAGGGNAIVQSLNNVLNNVTLAGGVIAGLSLCGAWAGSATGNHGVVGPSLKGAGAGAGIAAAPQLVGLAIPGGGAGASLTAPSMSVVDMVQIAASALL